MEANREDAQASEADLAAARLSAQAELAQDYFLLRGQDAQKKLLDETVASFGKALALTRNRYNGGIAAKSDLLQAETQLKTTQAQAIDLGVQRAQLEHAIALLIGKPASSSRFPSRPSVNLASARFRRASPRSFWSAGPTSPRPSGAWLPPTPRSVSPRPHIYPTVIAERLGGCER